MRIGGVVEVGEGVRFWIYLEGRGVRFVDGLDMIEGEEWRTVLRFLVRVVGRIVLLLLEEEKVVRGMGL